MALNNTLNSTGDTDETYGRPAWILRVLLVLQSTTIIARLSDRHLSTQRTILLAMLSHAELYDPLDQMVLVGYVESNLVFLS